MARVYERQAFTNESLPEVLTGTAFMEEAGADTFVISDLPFTPVNVLAHVLRADSVAIAVDGTLEDGAAVVTLHADCYHVAGRLSVAIYITDANENSQCVYACIGNVYRTLGSSELDSGAEIPTLAQLEAAYEACVEATEDARAIADCSVRFDEAQTLTIAQKAQALANIGAIQQGKLPLGNILADKQNVHGTNTVTGRTVTVDGNKITYSRTGSGSTWRDISLTGNTLNAYSVNSSSMPSSTLNAGDFVTIPKAFSLANKRRIYLWLYSPDNASLTFGASGSSGNRFQIATRPAEGDDTIDDGRYFNLNAGGYYVVLLAKTYPSIYSAIVTNGNIAVYYMTKNTTSAADGTLYWGIGLADHDLYDEETITDTEVTITADSGITYNCTASAVTSLSFTPSSSGICAVRFKSGTTATSLTLPSTVKMPSWWAGVEASTTYEIIISDGVYGAVMSWT